jgi:DNA-directed RNA polymerase II subunit RPB1
MFNKNISIQDVVSVIKAQFADINIVYSDYNSSKLVMRMRIKKSSESTLADIDDFTHLKKFQNKLLNSIVIRGIPGIKAATFRKDGHKVQFINGKYESFDQYIMDTDGSNFVSVMNHPAIDGTKLYSTNVHDIFDILGTEATRAVLYNEMAGLFESVGVNYRHLGLLCDIMTRSGRLISIDRYGINKNDIGPLAKASFEETDKIMRNASLFGEVDPVTGVSANIMFGQPFRGGTSFSQILFDETAHSQMLESMPETHDYADEQEEDADIVDLIDDGLRVVDPCSTAQFQMNIAVPPKMNMLEEPDVDIYAIDE